MSKNIIKTVETLMLRRIDPAVMIRRYLAGEFRNLKIPKGKVKLVSAFVNLNSRVGKNQSASIYRFVDKTNTGQLILTTNNEQYKKSLDNNNSSNHPTFMCQWCRRKINGEPLGIPVSMEIEKYSDKAIFNVEDTYDTFGCALAALKRFYSCHRLYKDPNYMNAEQLLYCMFYRMYPNKKHQKIREAHDWRLLDINGGPMTSEEYDSEQYDYISLPNLVLAPVKRQYVKLTIKK